MYRIFNYKAKTKRTAITTNIYFRFLTTISFRLSVTTFSQEKIKMAEI